MAQVISPSSLSGVAEALERHEGRSLLVAGGTAAVLMLKVGIVDPQCIVSMQAVRDTEYWTVTEDESHLYIGAGVRLSDVASNELVDQYAPALQVACSVVGNVRVRNQATLGGVVAESDYASDPPAVLVNLGAECVVRSAHASRIAPVREVQTGYYETSLASGEVISSLRISKHVGSHYQSYRRFNTRTAADRPCVGVALRLASEDQRVRDAAIVLGGVSPTPFVVPEAEELCGADLSIVNHRLFAQRAARRLDPISDDRASAAYRRSLAAIEIARALTEAVRMRGLYRDDV